MGGLPAQPDGSTLLIDTRTVAARDRVDFWASSASEVYHPLHIRTDAAERFQARMWGHRFGSLNMFRVAASANTLSRSRNDIAVGDPECLQLSIVLNGRLRMAQRHTSVLGPGDMTIYDSSEPAVCHAPGPFDMIVLELPKTIVGEDLCQLAGLTGTRVPHGSGLPRLALRFAQGAAAGLVRGGLPDGDGRPEEFVLELLRRIDLHASSPRPPEPGARADLLCRARAYIDTHLGDPTLNPEQIAAACYISTRYLHRLFAGEGLSVGAWIRRERVARCRRDLLDPARHEEAIATIATRWGLPSASHFSRLFREANGCSPREFRRTATAGGGIR